jgi:4'-phosphopantetheinyl transferase
VTAEIALRIVALDGPPADDDGDLLDASERRRAHNMRSAAARTRFVRARVALRRLVADVTRVDISTVQIETTPLGCPWLPRQPDIHVSVSHTTDLAVVAVANSPVGIDVERLDRERLPPPQAWMTASEQQTIDALDATERPRALIRLWTTKEAAAKALGLGLLAPLKAVRVNGDRATYVGADEERVAISLCDLDVDDFHVVSAAMISVAPLHVIRNLPDRSPSSPATCSTTG